jgi:hypothetical protein
MLQVEESVGRALTPQEEAKLLVACSDSRSRTLYPAVVLALKTGMRSIEIRSLRWAQVDLAAKMLRVGRSKTDAGAGRMIPLNDRAAIVLRDWAANFSFRVPEHHIFPSERYGQNGTHYASDPSKPMGSFKEAGKRHANAPRSNAVSMISGTRPVPGCSNAECLRVACADHGVERLVYDQNGSAIRHIADNSLRQAMALLDQKVDAKWGEVSRRDLEGAA